MAQSCMLLLSDNRGVFIPQHFAEGFRFAGIDGLTEADKNVILGVDPSDVETCRLGTDAEWYWEAWDSILNNAHWLDEEGNKFFLYQDGDLWGCCLELMTREERENFGFDTSDMEEEDEEDEDKQG